LHEAIGHAAEHEHAPIAWPSWLTVHDEPQTIDDCGNAPRITNLLHEPPASLRRESFRDIPLRRMSSLVARGEHEFELPHERIEVHLVESGHYEPLTETVTLRIAAATDGTHAIAPFDFIATRHEIARALRGAKGEPLEYPGVICSSEGQELFVGSFAPELLTVFA
ncbi:MAG TPA: hypothetical protein VMU84_02365, partial [Thermoanaerobaculia bacterium]|nr:hypothetical protein [Thermoanaerobaculia bacterium]